MVFNYTEEYTLEKSPSWLTRKYKQSQNFYNQRREKQQDITTAVTQVVSSMFSEEKIDMLLPSYKEALEQAEQKEKGVSNGFVQGEWWKK